jgi:hypothetical protein
MASKIRVEEHRTGCAKKVVDEPCGYRECQKIFDWLIDLRTGFKNKRLSQVLS